MPRDDDDDGDDSEIRVLRKELDTSLARNQTLEKENQELKQEVARLRTQINSLKAHSIERKSILWKKLQNSIDGNSPDVSPQKPLFQVRMPEQNPAMENLQLRPELPRSGNSKERHARVPKPPPPPTSGVTPSVKNVKEHKGPPVPAPAPPPPPLPSKLIGGRKALRRVPEVMELYRSLTKRDAQIENKTSAVGNQAAANPKNMIGEIENRSTYVLAIKSDVETHREFITFLAREVDNAAYTEISDVEAFVKWLDEELSYLVDERAVLKHFPQWPERKSDALREAAFSYRDLKNLESEISSFEDNPKQPLSQALRRMQALQDRLERSVGNMERMRENTSKRYRAFQIPWQWMLDTGLIGQMKLSSMKLVKEHMKRITKELQSNECSQEEDLMLQGVRFAYRVHQFAGGFDADTVDAFRELREAGNSRTGGCKQGHDNDTIQAC
ncbi:protein CHUP1, chloroplastic [Malania oleifera]|uniref:protein CHUP1, chloroplastic n=1 Tax=Malania oleifera TaxID=397392 RepID=UPI0025AE47D2|nr:protein CHUP1, chloroplastic [Malania oleifera]